MKRLFSKGKSSSGSATAGGGGGDAVKNLPKLHKYAYTGDLAKLSAALKKTSNVNETEPVGGRTALHLAAEQGHEKIVLRLLEVNAASRGDDTGKTPLILAVQQQHEPCVLALLHAGADPNAAATAERNTALHYASQKASLPIVKALLEFDADTDAENKRGGTPLHTSGVAGTTDIAKLLIDAGAGISLVDSYGRTPLMMAAGGGHGELVDLLIQEGADKTVVDNQGMSAMDYATNNQHRQIANHLATSAGSESEGTPQAGSSLLKSALPEKPTAAVSLPTNAPAQASVAGPASVPTPRDPAPMSATGPPPASAKPALLTQDYSFSSGSEEVPSNGEDSFNFGSESEASPPKNAKQEPSVISPSVTLDVMKRPDNQILSPEGSVMSHADQVTHGTTLIDAKLNTPRKVPVMSGSMNISEDEASSASESDFEEIPPARAEPRASNSPWDSEEEEGETKPIAAQAGRTATVKTPPPATESPWDSEEEEQGAEKAAVPQPLTREEVGEAMGTPPKNVAAALAAARQRKIMTKEPATPDPPRAPGATVAEAGAESPWDTEASSASETPLSNRGVPGRLRPSADMAKLADDEAALQEEEEEHAAARPSPRGTTETPAERRSRLIAAVEKEKEELARAQEQRMVQELALRRQMDSMQGSPSVVKDSPAADISPAPAAMNESAPPSSEAAGGNSAAVPALREELAKALQDKAAAEKSLAAANNWANQLEQDLQEASEKGHTDAVEAVKLRAELAAAQREVEAAADIIGGMQEQVDEAAAARDVALAAKADLEDSAKQAKAALESANAETASAKEARAQAEADMGTLAATVRRLEQEMAAQREADARPASQSGHGEHEERVASLQGQCDDLQAEVVAQQAAHRQELQQMESALKAAEAKAISGGDESAARLAESLEALRKAQQEIQSLQEGLEDVTRAKVAAVHELQEAGARADQAESQLAAATADLDEVGEKLRAAERQLDEVGQGAEEEPSAAAVALAEAAKAAAEAEAAAYKAQADAIADELKAVRREALQAEDGLRAADEQLQEARERADELAAELQRHEGARSPSVPADITVGAPPGELEHLKAELEATLVLVDNQAAKIAAKEQEVALVKLQLRTQREPLDQTAGRPAPSAINRSANSMMASMLASRDPGHASLDDSLREQHDQENAHRDPYKQEEAALRDAQELHRVHDRDDLELLPILPTAADKGSPSMAHGVMGSTRRQPEPGHDDAERRRVQQELEAARAQSSALVLEVEQLRGDIQLLRDGVDPSSVPDRPAALGVAALKDELDQMHDQFDALSRAKAAVEYTLLDTETELRKMVQARDDEAISRQIAEKALGDQTRIARQLEADYQELAQEGRRTAANLTEAEAEAAALREALGRMNEERDRLEVRVTVAEDAAALSQQLLAEAELLQARLAAEVEALGGDTAALSEAKDAATAAKGAAEQELQDLRQQVALLRHDLDVAHGRAEEQAQALDSAAAKSRTEAATLRGELDSVERERDALVRELEEYTRKTQRQERDHAKAMVDLAEMQGRNTASSSKVVSLERQIADLTATLQQEGAAATLRRDEAAAEVAQRQATERRLMDRVAELEAAVASGNSGAESTANTLRQAQEEAARLKSELSVSENDRKHLQANGEAAETQVRGLRDELKEAAAKVMNEQKRAQGLEIALADAKRDLGTAQSMCGERDRQLQDAQGKYQALMDTQREGHSVQQAQLQAANDALQKKLDNMDVKVRQLEEDKKRVGSLFERAQSEMDKASNQLAQLKGELAAAKKREDALDGDNKRLASDLQGARQELGDLEKERDRLADDVETTSERLRGKEAEAAKLAEQLEGHHGAHEELMQAKAAVDRLLMAAQQEIRELQSALKQENAMRATLENGIESVQGARGTAEHLLAELQERVLQLDTDLAKANTARDEAEKAAAELRRLWEGEVQSRSKLGAKMLELEQAASTWAEKLDRERRRTEKAMLKKQDAENRLDGVYQRAERLQRENGSLAADLDAKERQLKAYELGHEQPRAAAIELKMQQETLARMDNQLRDKENQVHQLKTTTVPRDQVERDLQDDLAAKLREVNAALEQDAAIRNTQQANERLNHDETVHDLQRRLINARGEAAEARVGALHRAQLRAAEDQALAQTRLDAARLRGQPPRLGGSTTALDASRRLLAQARADLAASRSLYP